MSFSSFVDRYFIKQPKLRKFVTKALYGEADGQIRLFGLDLTVNTLLENGYTRASRAAQHMSVYRDEAAVLLNLCSLIQDGTTFIDAGANIGLYSAAVARIGRLKKEISVLAFEVDPTTYGRLKQNADAYAFQAFNLGLSDQSAINTFTRGAVSHVTVISNKENSYSLPGERFQAQCVRLDELRIRGSSIVIKIDVEGHELEVLDGAGTMLDDGRVRAIYFDGMSDESRIRERLLSKGFEFFDGCTLLPAESSCFNLLAIRR